MEHLALSTKAWNALASPLRLKECHPRGDDARAEVVWMSDKNTSLGHGLAISPMNWLHLCLSAEDQYKVGPVNILSHKEEAQGVWLSLSDNWQLVILWHGEYFLQWCSHWLYMPPMLGQETPIKLSGSHMQSRGNRVGICRAEVSVGWGWGWEWEGVKRTEIHDVNLYSWKCF